MRFDDNLFNNLNLKIILNLSTMTRSRNFFVSKIWHFCDEFYNESVTFSSIFRIINKYFSIDLFRKVRTTAYVLMISRLLRCKPF